MYLNNNPKMDGLGTVMAPGAVSPHWSKETVYDGCGMSPFECSYYQEPLIDDPENMEDRGFPSVADSPFEQVPPYQPHLPIPDVPTVEKCCVPMQRLKDLSKIHKDIAKELDEMCETPSGKKVSAKSIESGKKAKAPKKAENDNDNGNDDEDED